MWKVCCWLQYKFVKLFLTRNGSQFKLVLARLELCLQKCKFHQKYKGTFKVICIHLLLFTCNVLPTSLFLIHVFPWFWGSMSNGYRVDLVTIRPFWIDSSSFGRPCRFHSLIVELSTNMLMIFKSCKWIDRNEYNFRQFIASLVYIQVNSVRQPDII